MTVTLILYILRGIAALLIPAAAFVFVRTKFSGKLRNFFDGAAVYFIFCCLIFAVVATYLQVFTKLFENRENSVFQVVFNIVMETACISLGYILWFKAAIKTKNDNGAGLMTGVGFSSLMLLISYALPSVVNAVIAVMYMTSPDAQISAIFEENINQVVISTPLSMFFDLIYMISVFCIETAVATVFYRVLNCDGKKRWIAAAVLLRIAAYIVMSLTAFLDRAIIVIILVALAVAEAGIAYSLINPFVAKKEQ